MHLYEEHLKIFFLKKFGQKPNSALLIATCKTK